MSPCIFDHAQNPCFEWGGKPGVEGPLPRLYPPPIQFPRFTHVLSFDFGVLKHVCETVAVCVSGAVAVAVFAAVPVCVVGAACVS